MNPQNKKSLNLDMILQRNHQMNKGIFFENVKNEKLKIRMKLT